MKPHKKICRETGHKWLEAIDADAEGNLYFTEGVGNRALYRHKRNRDGTLNFGREEKLLELEKGLIHGHAGGVDIDRENNDLYLGIVANKQSQILKIPLALFDEPFHGQRDLDWFRKNLDDKSLNCKAFDIKPAQEGNPPSPKPNGVAFDPKTNNVYYAHEDFLNRGKAGYVGDANNSQIWESNSPNGLAIDNSSSPPVLVVSQYYRRAISRLRLPDLNPILAEHDCGFFPDGIICVENGSVLAVAPQDGKVYHLPWNGTSYGIPKVIASGLDMPTDLVIAKSSSGEGESLFVTTTKLYKLFLGGAGNIFEIPYLDEENTTE
jgi:hypothetical protein